MTVHGLGTPRVQVNGRTYSLTWGNHALGVAGNGLIFHIPNDRLARMLGSMPLARIIEREAAAREG